MLEQLNTLAVEREKEMNVCVWVDVCVDVYSVTLAPDELVVMDKFVQATARAKGNSDTLYGEREREREKACRGTSK